MSPDPLGIAGGLRPNAYVDNPNAWVDPLGLTAKVLKPGDKRTWGPHERGPLSAKDAATFRGGSYTETILEKDLVVYRVFGGEADPIGRFWTSKPAVGPLQSQLDSALLPSWGNTVKYEMKAVIPQGTRIFKGFSAPQLQPYGAGNIMGGGQQILVNFEDLGKIKFGGM